MRRVIYLLLLLTLVSSSLAVDTYNVNFIIPDVNVTPIPISQSSGGSGGATGIIYERVSPPMVSVTLKTVSAIRTEIILTIKNEGKIPFEYGYLWNLEKYNESSKIYDDIETKRMSKFLNPNELSEIPIIFNNLGNGKYNFKVNVEYGNSGKNDEYISKASVGFTIGAGSLNQLQALPSIVKNNFEYTTIFAVGLIGVAVFYYQMRFRVRKYKVKK